MIGAWWRGSSAQHIDLIPQGSAVRCVTMPCLQAVREHAEEHAATLGAFSLCAQHLEEILLDRKVLPFGSFRQLPGCQKIGDRDIRAEMPPYLSLDGSAFDNLEVRQAAKSIIL